MRLFFLFLLIGLPAFSTAQRFYRPPLPPAELFRYEPSRLPGAWQYWLQHRPPMRSLVLQKPADYTELLLQTAPPPVPDDDPFAENLTLYREGHYQLGISGGKGFNLQYWPRTLAEWRRFLRLANLLRFRQWIQPESNELRLQNLVGASFYFIF